MTIEVFIAPKTDAQTLVVSLLNKHFLIESSTAERLYNHQIKRIIERLIDEVYLVAETNYVDKVYRDSFYSYYASKLFKYSRDCIRISLFNGEVTELDFRGKQGVGKLRENYLGYFILRPTDPAILGRNLISPQGLNAIKFSCSTARYSTTVNGIKLQAEGFPHSSQDKETITCAETTLWSVMEYFSHKYPEYKPVLPSKIIQTLNRVSAERQVPSKGLNIQQMSYALREFGFGTRIYSKTQYKTDFKLLLAYYIESGIPLIIAMGDQSVGIGHALLCIGREHLKDAEIDKLKSSTIPTTLAATAASKGIEIQDFAEIERAYVFVDDNHCPYQVAHLNHPANHYPSDWHTCQITFFLVPLYQKIYLEAYQAKNYIMQFLIKGPKPLSNGTKTIIRLYLASSRTFKDSIAQNESFHADVKEIILETPMPKFIWVCELTDKIQLKEKKANGIIILDATEANIFFNKPLIIAAYEGHIVTIDTETKKLEEIVIPLGTFEMFEANLKSFTHDQTNKQNPRN